MKGIILSSVMLLSICSQAEAFSLQDGKTAIMGYYNAAKPVVIEKAKNSMDKAQSLFSQYKTYDSQHSWIVAKVSAALLASYLVYKGYKCLFKKKPVTFSSIAPATTERSVKVLANGVKVMPSGYAHPTNRDPKKQNPKLAAFQETLTK